MCVRVLIVCVCLGNHLINCLSCNRNIDCSQSDSSSSSTDFFCYCDDNCHNYGDCCQGVPKKSKADIYSQSKWSCFQVKQRHGDTIGVQMISKCPLSWQTKSIEDKCVKNILPKNDVFLSIPIFSKLTELTYKNLYCAVCNDDADFAEPWIVYSKCRSSNSYKSCVPSVYVFEPPQTKNVSFRECLRSDVNECPQSWNQTNYGIDMKCRLYNNHFWSKTHRVMVKNEYCAICNNISLNSLQCPEKLQETDENPSVSPSFKFSFAMIIDIDFNSGGSVVGTKARCSRNYVYDPWKKFCRLVTCDKDLRFIHNKCVPVHKINNHTHISSCPKLVFEPTEYTLSENGTVTIISRNKTLQLHEYNIDMDTGKLSVCASLDHISLMDKFTDLDSYLSVFGISVSIMSLTIKIIIFFTKPEPRRVPNILVLFLSTSVLFAQTLFLLGVYRTDFPNACKTIAIMIHYFFLSSFFWMNALSFDIYCTFGSFVRSLEKKSIRAQILKYCLYGWIAPTFVVLAAITCDQFESMFSPNYGMVHCWISNRFALLLFFAIPIAVLLLINIGFFLKTACEIYGVTQETKIARENLKQREKNQFVLYIKLALIMGVTWLFGFIAPYANNVYLWYMFIIFNSLQGFYILIAFTNFKVGEIVSKIRQFSYKSHSSSTLSASTKF